MNCQKCGHALSKDEVKVNLCWECGAIINPKLLSENIEKAEYCGERTEKMAADGQLASQNSEPSVIKMFENPGKKLKSVSQILFWIGIIPSLIYGYMVFDDYGGRWIISLVAWIVVPLFLYVNTLFWCAIGEMAEKKTEDTKTE